MPLLGYVYTLAPTMDNYIFCFLGYYILVSWCRKELPLPEISNARPIVNTTPSPSPFPPAIV